MVDLMHAPVYKTIGEPLDLLSSLDEKAAVWDADGHAPAVLQPHRQPRKARLAVDGQEVEVVVVACIAGPCRTVPLQINTCMACCQLTNLLLSGTCELACGCFTDRESLTSAGISVPANPRLEWEHK